MSRPWILAVGCGLVRANAHPDCHELCKYDEGVGGNMQQCLTECSTYMDLAPPHRRQDAAQKFVEDQALNEKGGLGMKKAYQKLYGQKIEGCEPSVDISTSPDFDDIDGDKDGSISREEAVAYGNRMCVPDEMTTQIFVAADRDRDELVSSAEFDSTGEDNLAEEAIDKMADPATQGDDEYAEASVPSFDAWDHDKDGYLQKGELFDAFMHEMKRRDVADFGTVTAGTGKQAGQEEARRAIFDEIFPSIDHNDDGKVSRVEFNMDATDSDFGGELHESAHADEDAEDPDDARRPVTTTTAVPYVGVPSEAPETPASMLRAGHRHRSKKMRAVAKRLSTEEGGDSLPQPTMQDTFEVRKSRAKAAARFEAMLGHAADEAIRRKQMALAKRRRSSQND